MKTIAYTHVIPNTYSKVLIYEGNKTCLECSIYKVVTKQIKPWNVCCLAPSLYFCKYLQLHIHHMCVYNIV